jgi:CPA1 family monovalent cation:H+ antiporter
MTFGVVAFTIVVQGITMKPLIRLLGIGKNDEDDYSRARVRQRAIAAALSELESMADKQLISRPVHTQLRRELDAKMENENTAVDSILGENQNRLSDELQIARARLRVAETSTIEQAMHDGWVSAQTASRMIDESEADLGGPGRVSQEAAGTENR